MPIKQSLSFRFVAGFLAAVCCLFAQTTKVDYPTQVKNGPFFSDAGPVGQTIAQLCTGAGTGTLAVTKRWAAMTTQSVTCTVQFAGGSFQPASGQTVTLNQKTQCPAIQFCFDQTAGGHVVFTVPPTGLTPYNFGAKGDGATDDTAALQAALTASNVSNSVTLGGVVRVPAGTFMVSAPIVVPNRTTLRCDGQDVSFIRALPNFSPSTGAAVIVLANIAGTINEASMTLLDGCFIDASGHADYGVYSANLQEASGVRHSAVFGWNLYGIYLFGGYCQNYSLEDLWVIGQATGTPVPGRKAIYLVSTASSNPISRVTAVPNSGNGGPYGVAFDIASTGIVLIGVHSESALDGIYVEPGLGSVTVLGNWALSNVTNTVHIGYLAFASQFFGISQNGSPNGIVDDTAGTTTSADGSSGYLYGNGGLTIDGSVTVLSGVGTSNITTSGAVTAAKVLATTSVHALGNQIDVCPANVPLCAIGNANIAPVATISNTGAGATTAGQPVMSVGSLNATDAGVALKVATGGGQATTQGIVTNGNIVAQYQTPIEATHGVNAVAGIATLSSGTIGVGTAIIGALATTGAGYTIKLTLQTCSSCGALSVGTVTPGSGFVINSTSGSDASSVYWEIGYLN